MATFSFIKEYPCALVQQSVSIHVISSRLSMPHIVPAYYTSNPGELQSCSGVSVCGRVFKGPGCPFGVGSR
jgi:hypothetical protein